MTKFTTAREAADWINGQRWKGEKHGLDNTRALLAALGNPDRRMGKILHVAGTNGKGSTCAFLSSALMECGYNVGLFTSPYLVKFNERISLNGRPIPDGDLIDVASEVRSKAELLAEQGTRCTTFELLTACACLYYAEQHTDFAVMEVGMGGRLDSTNALDTSVSIIAAIGMDHMAQLGDTITQIAGEKAGIMRAGVPAVCLYDPAVTEVFHGVARRIGAPLYEVMPPVIEKIAARSTAFVCELPSGGLVHQRIRLPGRHQVKNAALALTALERLDVDMQRASRGIENAVWPGRLDWYGNVLVDCAHNPQAVEVLKDYVTEFVKARPIILVTGMMQDKQIEACSTLFKSFTDRTVATAVNWPRALSPFALRDVYGGNAVAVEGVEAALNTALKLAGTDGIVIAAGSVYIAGEVVGLLTN